MKYFLLFLFFPLSLSAVTCEIVEDFAGEVTIKCTGDSGGGEGGEQAILTNSDCERIKSQVGSVLASAQSTIESAAAAVNSIAQDDINPLINDCSYIRSQAQLIFPQNNNTSNIITRSVSMESDLTTLYNSCVGTASLLYTHAQEIMSLSGDLASYECSNQTCSGSGSGSDVTCPCQVEFNQLLSALSGISSQVSDLQELVSSNTIAVVGMKSTIDIISSSLTSVTNRLNAPDDRMWGELEEIYSNMHSNLNTIAKTSLDLQSIFYSIRKLIRGDGDEGKLNLTTEGVVSLVNSVFSMQGNLQNQYNLAQIDIILQSYTNQVLRYFNLFRDTIYRNALQPSFPPLGKYDQIYSAMTNTSLNARSRAVRLESISQAGVTNWFQRMELYQQAALGWFDTELPQTDFEENQSSLTESGLTHGMEETTNQLSSVVNSASNLAQRVNQSFSTLTTLTSGVIINPSLPTQLTILPQITIAGETFGPVYFETSAWSGSLNLLRTCTTFLWKVSFYVLILAAVYFVSKWAYGLVLYIMHIMQNL